MRSPCPPRDRLALIAKGGHKRKGVVNGSISHNETRCCLSPAVDSSHPTCQLHRNQHPSGTLHVMAKPL